MMSLLRKYLLAGLFVWLPIWLTFLLFNFIAGIMDHSLHLIPGRWQPDHLLGFHIPGLGIFFTIILLFVTGLLVTNFLGRRLMMVWQNIVNRIPLVRPIYVGIQQIMETILSPKGKAFRKVLLVEYPRKGMWSVAFQTGTAAKEINEKTDSDMITIFIPTTPNPTSGFLMMVPKSEVHELKMTVDQALKMVISLGVVHPNLTKESERKNDEE